MKRALDPDVRLLAAAADPTRLGILRQLSGSPEPVCVCDLEACCVVSQPTVSHHLRVLREAGWVAAERRGSWVWYSLRPEAAERLRIIAGALGQGPGATPATLAGGRTRLPVLQRPS